MRLPLKKTLRNIDRFLELKEKGGYKAPRLEAVMVDSVQTHAEIPRMKDYWLRRGIKLYVEPVENRAAQAGIQQTAVGVRTLTSFSWCKRLLEQIYVLYDGRVLQCCADWEQHSVMGDLTTESMANIWFGPKYTEFRERFKAGDVKGMICEGCRKQKKSA
jgi:radical SAM protein with 4Fe4S-binding SPASM domain